MTPPGQKSSAFSQPLEPAEALPVGDGGLERRQLDRRAVQVVLDDLLAERVARALETGVISINSNTSVRVATPFGGFKQSGVGRELGPHALEHYSEVKTVYYATGS